MTHLRTSTDLTELLALRMEVLSVVFGLDPESGESEELREQNRIYLLKHLAGGNHTAVIAEEDGETAGCGAVCFYEEMPSPDNPTGLCAYLMSIYVRAPWRHRGIAHQIVRRLINEARRRNAGKIYLETTSEARNIYMSLGFSDMRDFLKLES